MEGIRRFNLLLRSATNVFVFATLSMVSATRGSQTVSTSEQLSRALVEAMPGDTILVEKGYYIDRKSVWQRAFNPARSGTADKPIVIRSKRLHAATIRSRNDSVPALGIQKRKHIIIEGFRVEGGIGVKEGADSCKIRFCEVSRGFIQGGDVSLHWGIYISGKTFGCIVEHNYVQDMAQIGSNSHNGACVMIHSKASRNIIQHNTVDGGNLMHSGFGQKGGRTNNNLYRYNLARKCQTGFFGIGSTSRKHLSENNEYHDNVVTDCESFLFVARDCKGFDIHHNTAWRVNTFFYGGYHAVKKNNSDFSFRYNISDSVMFKQNHSRPAPWNFLISQSDFNVIPLLASAWHEATKSNGLQSWRLTTGFDSCSVALRPVFADPVKGDWRIINIDHLNAALSCDWPKKKSKQNRFGAITDSKNRVGCSWEVW